MVDAMNARLLRLQELTKSATKTAVNNVESTLAQSEAAVVAKRYVQEQIKGSEDNSEDPNFTALVEEFRSTRAFLREVLVFTGKSQAVRTLLVTHGLL